MDPVQVYETTIYNRDDGLAFSFVTVPARSLSNPMTEADATDVAALLELHGASERSGRALRLTPVEAWSLPLLIDATLGRYGNYAYERGFYFDPVESMGPRRGPSPFAQYVTFAHVVPIEASPLGGKALAELVTTGSSVGAAVGAYMTGDPILGLVAAGGIIVGGAASGIGEALQIGLQSKILHLRALASPRIATPHAAESIRPRRRRNRRRLDRRPTRTRTTSHEVLRGRLSADRDQYADLRRVMDASRCRRGGRPPRARLPGGSPCAIRRTRSRCLTTASRQCSTSAAS